MAEQEIIRVVAIKDAEGETESLRIEVDHATPMQMWEMIRTLTKAYPNIIAGALEECDEVQDDVLNDIIPGSAKSH